MTNYKPVKHAPKANKHKAKGQTETPQMRKPEPYLKPGKETNS